MCNEAVLAIRMLCRRIYLLGTRKKRKTLGELVPRPRF